MNSRTYVLLQNEGHLFHACLTQGLTALRNARVDKKGNVYVAFFQLSIGFERLMKVCLIMDHMVKNRLGLPNAADVRNYGHDLLKLFDILRGIEVTNGTRPLDTVATNSIEWELLQYLSEFGMQSRYFNLNELSSGKATENPLSHWKHVFERILREDVPIEDQNRVVAISTAAAEAIRSFTIVLANDEAGNPIDVLDAMAQPQIDDLTAPYAVWHLLALVRPFVDVLVDLRLRLGGIAHQLSHDSLPVPVMEDFIEFSYFNDLESCLKKTAWH